MGAAIQRFLGRFEEFRALPSGEAFTIEITDREATAAAREYLEENKAQIKALLKEKAHFELDVDDPQVVFEKDEIHLSVAAGKGFLKRKASLEAFVTWEGRPIVLVESVKVPIVSVSPEKLNGAVEQPVARVMDKVGEYADVRSFKVLDGSAVLEAVKK